MSAAVDVQHFAGDEWRPFEVEHGVDDVLRVAMRPMGCRPARKACIAGACIGVSITPGETAFTRIPRPAYSIPSARVTALRPPLVRAASAEGSDATGCSAIAAVMLTIWPEPACRMRDAARCEMWKNPARFAADIAAKSASE